MAAFLWGQAKKKEKKTRGVQEGPAADYAKEAEEAYKKQMARERRESLNSLERNSLAKAEQQTEAYKQRMMMEREKNRQRREYKKAMFAKSAGVLGNKMLIGGTRYEGGSNKG